MFERISDEIKPWIEIWYRPRETMQRFLDGTYNPKLELVIFLYILILGLRIYRGDGSLFFEVDWGGPKNVSLIYDMMAAGFSSILRASFEVWSVSNVYGWLGRLVGGKGDVKETRMVYLWFKVPEISLSILVEAARIVFQVNRFDIRLNWEMPSETTWWEWMIVAVAVILFLWRLVILWSGLAEVNGFSIWKGIAVWATPLVALGVILGVLHVLRPT